MTIELRGRTRERERIGAVLGRLGAGRSGALVLTGEPGAGKTSLLRLAAAERGEGLLLRARGTEAEAEVPFAALRALVEPLLPLRDRLAAGQRQALDTALALQPPVAVPHDRFAVAAALLGLLALAARQRPVLALVDDVQWLDAASRDALLFAARRLPDAPVVLLLGRRVDAPGVDDAGLERLEIGPLDRGTARALLAAGDVELAPGVAEQLLDDAAGNPLALVELPALLSPGERSGRAALERPLRPGPRLQRAFARQLGELTDDGRRAAAVAAAMESGPLGWLLPALARLGLDEAALAPLERSRVLSLGDGELTFRHPLVRAAAYHAADPEDRRRGHRALAGVVPDARRRAWHLAAAADDADATVAGDLEDAARLSRAVGGLAEAGWAFARAAELSADDAQRGRRELEAATDFAGAGQLDRAMELLEGAARRAPAEHTTAIARLHGYLDTRRGNPGLAHRLLTAEAARCVAAGRTAEATELLLEAIVAGTMVGDTAQSETVAGALTAGRATGGAHEVLAELAAAGLLVVRGDEPGGAAALMAVEPRLGEIDPFLGSEVLALTAQAWVWQGRPERAEHVLGPLIAALSTASALGRMPFPLNVRSQLAFRFGAWPAALADGREAVRLARDTGQGTMLAFTLSMLARLEAALGDDAAAGAHLRQALELCERDRNDGHRAHALAAVGFAELSAGRPAAAIEPLRQVDELEQRFRWRHPAMTLWWGDLIEALIAVGRRDEARAWTERLERRARETGIAWANAVTLRARIALEDDDDRLDALVGPALAWHDRDGMAFERARTELVVGERRRRARRRAAAREPLERALATFTALGAEPWAQRARDELMASGGRADGADRPLETLSEHERRLALLVARGMTNREVGAALHLSPKSIERQLGALYRRLGVRSRTELARLVADHRPTIRS